MTQTDANATPSEVVEKPTVFDVAEYILRRTGEISAWKLQKLVYYAQAWSLVWDEQPLFDQSIEAWANGPVCPDLYRVHRGLFHVKTIQNAHPNRLSMSACETINAVVDYYGKWTSQQLRDLTHLERPWRDARGDLVPGEPGHTVIELDAMHAYYEAIPAPAP